MRKSKKFTPNKSSKVSKSEHKSDELNDMSLSDDDSNQFNDEIDYFHDNEDKQLLSKSAFNQNINLDFDYESDDNEEEIMPLDDSEQDSSDDQNNGALNRFEVQLRKDEMASDLDDSDTDLPNSNAWGGKKNAFYNTDYVDKDFRKYKQKDEDLAQYEEEEALAIQRRLLQSMNESDIGIDLFLGDVEPKTASNNQISNEDNDEDEERLQTNLLNLTKRQKLEILKKESPELESLINDFRTYMTEIRDRLQPVMQLINNRNVSESTGSKYIETRYQILMHYCINICFYMVLKTKRIPVKDHPVIKQLLSYKKLLLELNSIASSNGSINDDIDLAIKKLSSGERVKFTKKIINKNKRKVEEIKNEVKKVKFADDLEVNNDLHEVEDEKVDNEANELSKRGITYEMAKNKGLTPKRKKELKNPRVKHRMKYRKAKIRRKGQVREPRKELQRYGGEISGIKSGVVKSVKFK